MDKEVGMVVITYSIELELNKKIKVKSTKDDVENDVNLEVDEDFMDICEIIDDEKKDLELLDINNDI